MHDLNEREFPFLPFSTFSLLTLFEGVASVEEAADLDVSSAPAFLYLDSVSRDYLELKINTLKEELILKYFLEEHDLLKYYDRYCICFHCDDALKMKEPPDSIYFEEDQTDVVLSQRDFSTFWYHQMFVFLNKLRSVRTHKFRYWHEGLVIAWKLYFIIIANKLLWALAIT